MLDDGETDWKVIAIDINDPLAEKLNDAADLEKFCPGLVEATRRWFEVYKIPDGKLANSFAFNGEVKDKAFALKVISDVHQQWKDLVSGKVPAESEKYNISISRRDGKVDQSLEIKIMSHTEYTDNDIPTSVHGWAFIPGR